MTFRTPTAVAAIFLAWSSSALSDSAFTFEVVEDHTRIVFQPAINFGTESSQLRARAFSTSGYVYPSGTLSPENLGVLENGAPTSPEDVIGQWSSEGWYIGSEAQATEGVQIMSRQIFEFRDGSVLVTYGEENWNDGETSVRAIEQATGRFDRFPDVMTQKLVEFASPAGLRLEFQIPQNAGGA